MKPITKKLELIEAVAQNRYDRIAEFLEDLEKEIGCQADFNYRNGRKVLGMQVSEVHENLHNTVKRLRRAWEAQANVCIALTSNQENQQ